MKLKTRAEVPTGYPVEDISWQELAACRDHDPEIWFPLGSKRTSPRAVEICTSCPVREACLAYALPKRLQGIWGGLTEEGRRNARRKRVRASCSSCGGSQLIKDQEAHSQTCARCGLSWVF